MADEALQEALSKLAKASKGKLTFSGASGPWNMATTPS